MWFRGKDRHIFEMSTLFVHKMEAASWVTISVVKVDITWCSTSASPPVALSCDSDPASTAAQHLKQCDSSADSLMLYLMWTCVFQRQIISWYACCFFYLFGYETAVIWSIKMSIWNVVLQSIRSSSVWSSWPIMTRNKPFYI